MAVQRRSALQMYRENKCTPVPSSIQPPDPQPISHHKSMSPVPVSQPVKLTNSPALSAPMVPVHTDGSPADECSPAVQQPVLTVPDDVSLAISSPPDVPVASKETEPMALRHSTRIKKQRQLYDAESGKYV